MVTFIAIDRASGLPVTILLPRSEFRLWLRELRALGKTRFRDVIFATATGRLQ